ncbi:MAG: dihydroorotase [Methanoregulaceae archaeon]|nr:dihydroorotase [Methanoregulaceae archaeon]
MLDLLIHGGKIVTPDGVARGDIGIRDGQIVAVGEVNDPASETLDATGLHIFPGVIDTQVHFREPGMEHKEDIESGTRAALHGGVTTIFEMPNTNPATTTAEALQDKLNRAAGRAWVDYAFFVGAATDNIDQLAELEVLPGTPGVKIFVGSSTGSLLVPDDDHIRRVFEATRYRTPIHSEDHPRLEERKALISEHPTAHEHPFLRDVECARLATERVLKLSAETGHPIHILHLSTADELPLIAAAKREGVDVTTEITPQHLWFSAPDCYDRLGTYAQMNPPLRSNYHRLELMQALGHGFFDVIGSDHAPHTREEKDHPYPKSPSGMPGVQTLLPVMITIALRDKVIDLPTIAKMTSMRPAQIYGIRDKGLIAPGYDADLAIVDLDHDWVVEASWLQSKCGWSPYTGETLKGKPVHTILRGRVALRDGERQGAASGQVVEFDRGPVSAV